MQTDRESKECGSKLTINSLRHSQLIPCRRVRYPGPRWFSGLLAACARFRKGTPALQHRICVPDQGSQCPAQSTRGSPLLRSDRQRTFRRRSTGAGAGACRGFRSGPAAEYGALRRSTPSQGSVNASYHLAYSPDTTGFGRLRDPDLDRGSAPAAICLGAMPRLPPEPLRTAIRPASFSPGPGIELPQGVFEWLPRYTRPPVLAYIDRTGWPVMTRVQAALRRDHIAFENEIMTSEGAPACLTYHRLVGNYWANDAFLIRGHFDAAGRLIPEKVVGFGGTKDDRGLGSLKLMRMILDFRRQLSSGVGEGSSPASGCPFHTWSVSSYNKKGSNCTTSGAIGMDGFLNLFRRASEK